MISNACADVVATAGSASPAFDFMQLAPLLLVFGVFYFLVIRPQNLKVRKQQEAIAALDRGDKVIVGGILGIIRKVGSDNELTVEIAEGVQVRALRPMVTPLGETPSAAKK